MVSEIEVEESETETHISTGTLNSIIFLLYSISLFSTPNKTSTGFANTTKTNTACPNTNQSEINKKDGCFV
jgi:hypothetical protein